MLDETKTVRRLRQQASADEVALTAGWTACDEEADDERTVSRQNRTVWGDMERSTRVSVQHATPHHGENPDIYLPFLS